MTQFRPCIDLHSGKVKQIVGGTLKDGENSDLQENFVSEKPASYYAEMYRADGLTGGHVIMLGKGNTEAAQSALSTWPSGLQVGGGITDENALQWIQHGASHVIITSYMFDGDTVSIEKIKRIVSIVGKDHLVLDLSCRRVEGGWVVAKDKWQTLTDLKVTHETLDRLSEYCCEFLIHAADVEGKCEGIDAELVTYLGAWGKIPITYAGGARSVADLDHVRKLSNGTVNLTYGSALDIFGGTLVKYADLVAWK